LGGAVVTPAERLRAAADTIERTANNATPGPWGVGNGSTVAADVKQLSRGVFSCRYTVTDLDSGFNYGEDPEDDGWRENGAGPEDDAAHVALWDPPTALLVAAWLRFTADEMGTLVYIPAAGDAEAVALADAILGGVS
jgi:hypothetical protein